MQTASLLSPNYHKILTLISKELLFFFFFVVQYEYFFLQCCKNLSPWWDLIIHSHCLEGRNFFHFHPNSCLKSVSWLFQHLGNFQTYEIVLFWFAELKKKRNRSDFWFEQTACYLFSSHQHSPQPRPNFF